MSCSSLPSRSTSSSSPSSDSSSSSSSSSSESESEDLDDGKFSADENDPERAKKEIKEIIRDNKLMKFEKQILENAGISSYGALRDCNEKQLKRIGMGYTDRDRLLRAFKQHIEMIQEKRHEKKLKAKKKKGKGKSGKNSSKSSNKSSKSAKSSKSKKGGSSSSKNKNKKKGGKKSKIDPDEALRKLDTGWSGKKQAWADYKEHEARVAELMEFYDEIGRKRTNGEEHARKLLCSYPGGIKKLVIALDKKYHHIPYGWEDILEEAYREEEVEGSASN
mmetsp:Transcript_2991/g.3471  ORF Transcript_2991/g.3471 Transcript_2991/m.3471 type:complete len:277 (-) Transcript_2991:1164-1994(-)